MHAESGNNPGGRHVNQAGESPAAEALKAWARRVDAHEAQEEQRARAAGQLPVLDYVEAPPAPRAVLEALREQRDPARRSARLREVYTLRKKAAKHEGLARMLCAKGQAGKATALQAAAGQLRSRADALDAQMRIG